MGMLRFGYDAIAWVWMNVEVALRLALNGALEKLVLDNFDQPKVFPL